MAYYKRCPNCGCDDHDWSIFRCDHNHLYCTGCSITKGGFLGIGAATACPRCGDTGGEAVGEIEPATDDETEPDYTSDNDEQRTQELEDSLAAAHRGIEELESWKKQREDEENQKRRQQETEKQSAQKTLLSIQANLDHLASDHELSVRRGVAENPSAPAEALQRLSSDYELSVRRAVTERR